jgi:protocatechuate 3,4-dioxygenase beta subunit
MQQSHQALPRLRIITVLPLLLLVLAACDSPSGGAATPIAPAVAPTTAASLPPAATAAAATAAPTDTPAATVATTEAPAEAAATEAPAEVATVAPAEAATTRTPQSAAAPAATCSSPATLTPALTEGPYFKAGSPERTSLLEPGMAGTKLVLTGYVLTADCKPVAHALIEFWQADANGQYDNSGYTLRGHQYTDDSGRYQLETVVPGEYPGRTEHIHVKVQAPNGPVLTTQLFFPGVARNSSDGIFNSSLVLPVQDTGNGLTATFNFVVRAG